MIVLQDFRHSHDVIIVFLFVQVEYIPEEQLMIALAGKQRQMRLIPVKALDQPADTEWIKVADTKGCLLFATGVMRPTATTSTILSGSFCLCVAVKRQVIVDCMRYLPD